MSKSNSMPKSGRRGTLIIAALLLLAASLAMVLVPVYIIWPFRPETPRGIHVSFLLRRWSPYLTILLAAGGLYCMWRVWKLSRIFGRIVAVLIALVSVVPVWASRQNHFEWFFEPLPKPGFASATNASFMKDGDMVMAIDINGEAAAYPIRFVGVHHVVGDSVGGQAVVATY